MHSSAKTLKIATSDNKRRKSTDGIVPPWLVDVTSTNRSKKRIPVIYDNESGERIPYTKSDSLHPYLLAPEYRRQPIDVIKAALLPKPDQHSPHEPEILQYSMLSHPDFSSGILALPYPLLLSVLHEANSFTRRGIATIQYELSNTIEMIDRASNVVSTPVWEYFQRIKSRAERLYHYLLMQQGIHYSSAAGAHSTKGAKLKLGSVLAAPLLIGVIVIGLWSLGTDYRPGVSSPTPQVQGASTQRSSTSSNGSDTHSGGGPSSQPLATDVIQPRTGATNTPQTPLQSASLPVSTTSAVHPTGSSGGDTQPLPTDVTPTSDPSYTPPVTPPSEESPTLITDIVQQGSTVLQTTTQTLTSVTQQL
jgi:hypothetical protein